MALTFWKSNSLSSSIMQAVQVVERITDADFEVPLSQTFHAAVLPLMQALHGLQTKVHSLQAALSQQQQQSLRAQEDLCRMLAAWASVGNAVLLADHEHNIVYFNPQAEQILQTLSPDLRKNDPQFDVKNLLGRKLDTLHKAVMSNAQATRSGKMQFSVGERMLLSHSQTLANEQGKPLGSVIEWQDCTQQKRAEANYQRMSTSLSVASSAIMTADAKGVIVHINEAGKKFFHEREAELRKFLPNFSADSLIGGSFDRFHKNPSHHHQLLAGLKEPHHAKIKLGMLSIEQTSTPIFDADGNYLGAVAEWVDKSQQDAFDQQIFNVIDGILRGKLSTRMDVSAIPAPAGIYSNTSAGINLVLDAILKPLNVTADYLARIAQGDMPPKITEKYKGDFNQIKNNLNTCIDAIKALIDDTHMLAEAGYQGDIQTRADTSQHQGDFRRIIEGINTTLETIVEPILAVKNATDSINMAAKEIASGNADLSQRTEEQATSLEKTASSMAELSATVKQNADSARQANQMVLAASDVAVRGGDMVQQVVRTMSAINDSARKIVDIISVIDGIAFQTNILALNAAVEAARAGEQGRGFAVVAGEVRSLAQRSAAAAKEIKTLIGDSVEKVQDGSKLVNDAGKTMDEIVNSVRRVTSIMAEIASASSEQSQGIEQVNQAIAQMDDVTQQNAALVEEAAAAAESLEEQAMTLAEAVAHFRLQNETSIHNVVPKVSSLAPRPVALQANASRKAPAPIANHNDDDWTEF